METEYGLKDPGSVDGSVAGFASGEEPEEKWLPGLLMLEELSAASLSDVQELLPDVQELLPDMQELLPDV